MSKTAAAVIDLLGLALYVGVLTQITSPPLGLDRTHLLLAGLAFPLTAYTVTWLRYRDEFWAAFIISLVIGTVAVFGLLWAVLNGIISVPLPY